MKSSARPVALVALLLASTLGIAAFSRVASNRVRSTSATVPETPFGESNAETPRQAPNDESTKSSEINAPSSNLAPPSSPNSQTKKQTPDAPTPDAVPVRTAVATTADVETKRSFRGFTDVDPVEIVPRVRGFLESIEFQPGALVEAGDVLFRVESFDYQNEVDAAKAELAAATARESRAKATHQRNLRLYKEKSVSGVVTEETLEESQTAWRAANAATAKARAALAAAEKQLERTIVRAPCRGQISRPFYPVGTFLDGSALDPPVLARLVAMNPMFVYFYATDREFLEFQQKRRDALKARLGERYDEKNYANVALREALQAENLPDYVDFEASFPGLDEKGVFSRRGVVNYVDVQVDRSTGVVALRGEIPNPDYSIYPGVVCEVALTDEPVKNATLIDSKAVCNDLNSQFVWVVDENDVPRRRTVELGRKTQDGSQVVATSGVKPGERYVVDGVLNLRPGLRVVEAAPPKRPASEPFSPNERETAVASTPETNEPTSAPAAAETFRAAKPVVPAPKPSPKRPKPTAPAKSPALLNDASPADAPKRPINAIPANASANVAYSAPATPPTFPTPANLRDATKSPTPPPPRPSATASNR